MPPAKKTTPAKKRSTGLAPTVPGLTQAKAKTLVDTLQARLGALTDLALTLKHIHWNVVGPDFIAVHEMLDPQYAAVSDMVDETAERIAALGGSPVGTPGALVAARTWDDYDLRRALAIEHLGALDLVYQGLIEDHRSAMDACESLDLVSQDMLIGQIAQLEKFLWFVRAHLERGDGSLITGDATTERGAARNAGRRAKIGA